MWIITIHHTEQCLLRSEELCLRSKIQLKCLVVVEMISRQVRKHGYIKHHSGYAMLIKGMRRHFHHNMRDTPRDTIMQKSLKVNCLGSRSHIGEGSHHFH